jgi:hypothetical protein
MYHAREPRFLGYAVENFGAACKKLGYTLPLREDEAVWLTYVASELEPAPADEQQFLLAARGETRLSTGIRKGGR